MSSSESTTTAFLLLPLTDGGVVVAARVGEVLLESISKQNKKNEETPGTHSEAAAAKAEAMILNNG